MEAPQENLAEIKQQQWQEKIAELKIPDQYGYIINDGIGETVAAMQLLDINTRQSCEGNFAVYPWVEFGAKDVEDVYVGEHESKLKKITELEFLPDEIDPASPKFDRGKQLDVVDPVKKELAASGAAFTPEFLEWRKQTLESAEKLQALIDEFYMDQPAVGEDMPRVCIDFKYRSPERPADIQDIPTLRVKSKELDSKIKEMNDAEYNQIRSSNQEEMKRFTEFLKEKFLSQ